MYINSTNLYIKPSEYISSIPSSLIASEKYYNCEDFFLSTNHKKRKLFQKTNKSNK